MEFDEVVDTLLRQYGADIQLGEIEVERLAKVATYIYGLTSSLARTNRSYCRHGVSCR